MKIEVLIDRSTICNDALRDHILILTWQQALDRSPAKRFRVTITEDENLTAAEETQHGLQSDNLLIRD